MKTHSLRLARSLGLAALLAASVLTPIRAVPMVALDPVNQVINVGDTAVVSLNVSGLGVGAAAPKLGGWLAHIAFNNTIVAISDTDVTFGTNLDLGVFGTLQGIDASLPGLLQLDEISFEDSAGLIASQPDAFSLATLNFSGLAPGTSALTFARLELSDELGMPLAASSTTASITVRGTGVSDAGAITLLGAACLAALCGMHARRRVMP